MKLCLGGYGPAKTVIDTEHNVLIKDAYVGTIFKTVNGECLTVMMRDDGYELYSWREESGEDPIFDAPLPSGAIAFSVNSYRGILREAGEQ